MLKFYTSWYASAYAKRAVTLIYIYRRVPVKYNVKRVGKTSF